MLTPTEERWAAAKAPWVSQRLEAIEEIDDKQWSISQTRFARNNELIALKHAAQADIANFDREAEAYGYVDGEALKEALAPLTPAIGRAGLPNSGNPVGLDLAVRRAAEKRLTKAKAALEKHQREMQASPGRASWAEKLGEARDLIGRLAADNADVEAFEFTGRPSRKRLTEATKDAEAAAAERSKVTHSRPPLPEAKVLARAAIRATPPLKVTAMDFELARLARVPTIGLSWRDGNSAPSAIDLADMLGWLAGERIEDEVFAQLERQYADFARQGILTMSNAAKKTITGYNIATSPASGRPQLVPIGRCRRPFIWSRRTKA